MNIFMLIIYVLLGFCLFFINNYLQKGREESSIVTIIFPAVFIIVVAGLLSNMGLNSWNKFIFLIVVFELCLRLYYVKSILRRDSLVNNKYYVKNYAITLLLCYVITTCFIAKVDSVFPKAEEMRTGIWFLIILFGYMVLKDSVKVSLPKEKATFIEKKQEYVVMQYAKFKNQYSLFINKKVKEEKIVSLLYAIMIYENYIRPPYFRKIDRLRYRFTGNEAKLGIMQVLSSKEIDDEKSIQLSISRLEKINSKISLDKKKKKDDIVTQILSEYSSNTAYCKDVLDIYLKLIEFDAK